MPDRFKNTEISGFDAGFLVGQNPDSVIAPDLCIIDRRKDIFEETSFSLVRPDVVIEVLSPSNSRKEMQRKVELYLDFGVREIWIVSPKSKQITIHAADSDLPHVLAIGDTIECTGLLDGIRIPVRDVFED